MPILTIIRGLPGSGKSTLAKALVAATGACHYETDMFFDHPVNGYQFNPHKIKEAHSWCQSMIEATMRDGCDVIVSNTFTQQWEVQPYIDLAEQYGYQVQIIECKADFGNVHGVPSDAIERMRKRWESVSC